MKPIFHLNLFLIKIARSCWLLCLLVFIPNFLPAQEVKKQIINGDDTASIGRLINKAFAYRETQADSSGYLYKKALSAAITAGYRIRILDALFGLGRYYNIKNQHRTAVRYLSQSSSFLSKADRTGEPQVTANLLLSESYYYLGMYDSCAYYRYEALRLIETNPVGNAALRLRVYSKILQFWLNVHEDIRHDTNIQQIMERINALEKQALAASDSNLLVNIYFQKEGYYHNISKNDSARYYGLRNIDLGKRLNVSPSMIMAAYLNIAITYIDDKNPEAAITNIRKAVELAPEQGRASNRYLIFGDIILGQAYNLAQQYRQAIAIAVPAVEKAKALNINSIMELAHETLADAYEGTGDFRNAAIQRKLYSVVKDSLMKSEKMELMYTLEMKSRIAEKNKALAEKELSLVKNEIRIRNKNILIAGISIGGLLILVISLLVLRNNRHKQKLQAEKIIGLQQEMEIKLLKAMVNGSEKERSRIARDLHDGVSGTIGSIRARLGLVSRKHTTMDVSKDFTEIMRLLEDAATEIRKTAHNLMPEILLQEGLVSATELFCKRVASSNAIEINFVTHGEIQRLPQDQELLLYRTIQELVQNILKHAKATTALVQLVFNGPVLSITVEDNGQGINRGNQRSFGIGLTTITERIHAMKGTIDISGVAGEGTSIYIELDTTAIKESANEHQTYDHG